MSSSTTLAHSWYRRSNPTNVRLRPNLPLPDQDIPFSHRLLHAAPDAFATVDDAYLASRAPEGAGIGVDWIGQNAVHNIVCW
jgi:hypothetical protein